MAGSADKSKYYMGDKNLPVPDSKHEYTINEIKELSKCAKDITYFAENYFYIVTVENGKQKIPLYPAQKRIIKNLVKKRFNIVLSSRQAGKALDLNTPIPTPNGYVPIGEIKDGDIIYGDDGKEYPVLKAHEPLYNEQCYEMEFDTGEKIIAHGGHLWFTETIEEEGSKKTTEEIYNTLYIDDRINHKIPSYKGFMGNEIELPVDPYTCGTYIASNDDYQPLDPIYLQASRSQRLELIRGYMDICGMSKITKYIYTHSDYSNVKDFCMVLSSLGIKYTQKPMSSCIEFKTELEVFKYKKCKYMHIEEPEDGYVYIIDVKKVESRPVRCLTVGSPNSLFLCGNTCIPTSNTTMMTIYALWETSFRSDKRILIVANKEDTAKMILRRIKLAYEQLPNWLKPGIKQWDKTEVIFGNDSSIVISTTTASAARGESINCVTGDSIVTIRDKETKEVFDIPIEELYKIIENDGEALITNMMEDIDE